MYLMPREIQCNVIPRYVFLLYYKIFLINKINNNNNNKKK